LARVLLTGIASHRHFLVSGYDGIAVSQRKRRLEIETIADLREDMRVCINTGNLLIGEGAMAALEDGDNEVTYLPMFHLLHLIKDPENVKALRAAFDRVVLATANIFRPSHSAHSEALILKTIGLPAMLMGGGLQVRDRMDELPPGTLELIDFLADNANAVLTRGQETADFLVSKGVQNVTPTGCPSVYLKPAKMLRALGQLPKVGHFSNARKIMVGGYIGHHQSTIDIEFLQGIADELRCVLQDEFVEYGMQLEQEDSPKRAYDMRTGEILSRYGHPSQSERDPRPPIHIFLNNSAWRDWASDFDLYFGRRFHGGIAAMQAGVPSIFVTIDDRMREMLNWLGFPHIEAAEFNHHSDKQAFLADWLSGVDGEALRDNYRSREEEFRAALRMFGV
jgi:hypothetical protein